MVNFETIKCIDIIDGKEVEIELRNDIGLFYTEDGKNYSLRYDFKYNLNNDIENYMLYRYDIIRLDEFTKEELDLMRKNDFEGKYVYQLITETGDVFNNYYTFMGMENQNEIKVVPVKITLENKFNIDPRTVRSTSWYYLESKEPEFIEISQILNEHDNLESDIIGK